MMHVRCNFVGVWSAGRETVSGKKKKQELDEKKGMVQVEGGGDLTREDYALLQTNGWRLSAICHICIPVRRRSLPLAFQPTIARLFLVFVAVFGVPSFTPGAIHRSPGNCQRSAPQTQV